MIEKLDGNYIRGYTQALVDLLNDLPGVYADCNYHKVKMNQKQMEKYIQKRIENRENLRENLQGFIRYNGVKKEWEWFNGR